jgi:predicted RecA/RadA family phage recombinase
MKTYISSGGVITVTVDSDTKSGDLVAAGALIGFAQTDADAGTDCAIVTAGVYTTSVAAADTVSVGDVIYLSAGTLTTDATDAVRAGIAVTAGEPMDGMASVQVKINA